MSNEIKDLTQAFDNLNQTITDLKQPFLNSMIKIFKKNRKNSTSGGYTAHGREVKTFWAGLMQLFGR